MKKLKKDKLDNNQTIKKDTDVVKLIRKANRLVEGKYRFDIWEMRVFTKMLMKIHRDDEDFKVYRIYLHEVIQDFELQEDGHSYKFLKQGAERLGRREIRVLMDTPDGKMELFTHIATGVKSFVEEKTAKYLDISFHPDMKPYLLQLQSQFLMYDVRNILKLQSSFSIRIYELLKQYETIGKRTLKVQELKEMLDVVDKYPLYGNFKQRVIVKAQEDLEKFTDIKFTFDEVKSGRAVTGLVFWIIPNREKQDSGNLLYLPEVASTIVEDTDQEISQLLTLTQRWEGVSKTVVEQWRNVYGFETVLAQIKKTNKQISEGKKIHNPMGFVVWSLQNPEITGNVAEPVSKIETPVKEEPKYTSKQINFYWNGEFANWFVIYLQNLAINCEKVLYHKKVDELRATYSEKLFNNLFMFNDGSVNEESLNSSVGIKLLETEQKSKENIFQEWFWNKFQVRILQQRSGDWKAQ
ncbi:replication initiator protein [Arcicella aurantiaca]|uniref:Replication initiator protein n=1 Tax=Arcicella aurantiaca TaxID=591202 RepID=A0A316EDB8_9BACT|nr:replication initiation protein [Arcicella aurantiaca]PWK27619.1 replication initiator protein [Arcicella aurantiaca]